MQVAICDDENIFLEQLEVLLKSIPEIEKADSYNSVDKLCQQLECGYRYDIIFMDIEWNAAKENGTHYASRINELYPDIQIIFVTAYNDRFAEAIFWEPVNLCGYLLKPVQKDNLLLLLEKAKKVWKHSKERSW